MVKFISWATAGLQKFFETMLLYALNEMLKSNQQ